MTRSSYLHRIVLWAFTLLLLFPDAGWTADKPNFIVILVDDLGYNDLRS